MQILVQDSAMTRTMTLFLVLIAPWVIETIAAQKPAAKASAPSKQMRRTKPESENVYSDSWDQGEIKSCVTFSGRPALLICDDSKSAWPGSFINLLGNNIGAGKSEDQAYDRTFVEATVRSKQFLVEFLDAHGRDPAPWPEPQTGRKMTSWDCTKEKVISCSLGAREK